MDGLLYALWMPAKTRKTLSFGISSALTSVSAMAAEDPTGILELELLPGWVFLLGTILVVAVSWGVVALLYRIARRNNSPDSDQPKD